ncbi:hypothetical protein QR97_25410 [Streptomyces sp. PBH53]|nr:hypothetical protein QR97_25410 [Streptomyces sp. PBH53]
MDRRVVCGLAWPTAGVYARTAGRRLGRPVRWPSGLSFWGRRPPAPRWCRRRRVARARSIPGPYDARRVVRPSVPP